ncbi:MAG: PEP-CTERM sorting domain-containing protein [Pirellulaceae bacterium]|nr:PEP-CTERM sorting domain-containing protein [Planctomycetales bacterium]
MFKQSFNALSTLVVMLATTASAIAFDFTIIDVPGGTQERATGVNNLGQIVGSYLVDGTDQFDIWVREPSGTIYTFSLPNGRSAQTHRINDLGQVAGLSAIEDNPTTAVSFGWVFDIDDNSYLEFAYAPPGDPEPDAAITEVTNDGQTVVGWYDTTVGDFEYLGAVDSIGGGSLTTVDGPSDVFTFIWGTNDSGILVGREFRSAFISSDGVTFDLFQIDGNFTSANDINNAGVVVGSYFLPGFTEEFGFIRTADRLLAGIAAPNAVQTSIDGINDSGVFVGSFSDANGDSFAYFSVVPEPSSLLLFAGAVFGCLLAGRGRNR